MFKIKQWEWDRDSCMRAIGIGIKQEENKMSDPKFKIDDKVKFREYRAPHTVTCIRITKEYGIQYGLSGGGSLIEEHELSAYIEPRKLYAWKTPSGAFEFTEANSLYLPSYTNGVSPERMPDFDINYPEKG